MQAEAFAKVNLSLRVGRADDTGMHPLESLVHSIAWADSVALADATEDIFEVDGDHRVPDDGTNLAVRALEAVRAVAGRRDPVSLRLTKRIPVAAGLGGGSADAAAVLAMAATRFGVPEGEWMDQAATLGADVPFCLAGGAAVMEGYGERLTSLAPLDDFVLAVAVPPFALATAAVYRRWDDLDRPSGPAAARALPDSLRDRAPLVNDLVPAALDLEPALGDWITDLQRNWGTPVLMSGSGPALFAFFATASEAEDAVGAAAGMRAARACRPVPWGRRVEAGGTLH